MNTLQKSIDEFGKKFSGEKEEVPKASIFKSKKHAIVVKATENLMKCEIESKPHQKDSSHKDKGSKVNKMSITEQKKDAYEKLKVDECHGILGTQAIQDLIELVRPPIDLKDAEDNVKAFAY